MITTPERFLRLRTPSESAEFRIGMAEFLVRLGYSEIPDYLLGGAARVPDDRQGFLRKLHEVDLEDFAAFIDYENRRLREAAA